MFTWQDFSQNLKEKSGVKEQPKLGILLSSLSSVIKDKKALHLKISVHF